MPNIVPELFCVTVSLPSVSSASAEPSVSPAFPALPEFSVPPPFSVPVSPPEGAEVVPVILPELMIVAPVSPYIPATAWPSPVPLNEMSIFPYAEFPVPSGLFIIWPPLLAAMPIEPFCASIRILPLFSAFDPSP